MKFIWIFTGIVLILLLSIYNQFPDGMFFAGGDQFQLVNTAWIDKTYFYIWSHWNGEGGFSTGANYYPFFRGINIISQIFSLTASKQSIIFYLFYWGTSYLSFLWSLKLLKINNFSVFSWQAATISFIYALNPYTYYLFYLLWGFGPFPLLYPLIPLLTVSAIQYFFATQKQESRKYYCLLLLLFFLANPAFSNTSFFVASNFVLMALFSLLWAFNKNFSLFFYFKKLILLFSIELIASGWAVIPQINYFLNEASPVKNQAIFNFKEWILWQRLNLLDLFTLNPYGLSEASSTSITFIFGSIFIILILVGFVCKKRVSQINPFAVSLFIICIFIFLIESKGKGFISDEVAIWLYSNPVLGAFRSYGKLYIFLPTLLLLTLVYQISDYRKISASIALLILLFFNLTAIYPVLTGKIQTEYSGILENGKTCINAPRCNLNYIPPDYLEAAQIIKAENLSGKILSAPYSVINSPGWSNYPSWKHIGVDPTPQFFSLPVVQMNSYGAFGFPYGLDWARGGADNANSILLRIADLDIRYILFHKDADNRFIEPPLSYLRKLENNGDFHQIYESKNLIIFRVDDLHFRPIITAHIANIKPSLNLFFTQINPTKYQILLPLENQMIEVVFRESFSSKWELLLSTNPFNSDGIVALPQWWESFFFSKLGYDKHRLFEQYANTWQLNPALECKKYNCDVIMINNQPYILIYIEYAIQRLVYLLMLLSLAASVFIIIFWFICPKILKWYYIKR